MTGRIRQGLACALLASLAACSGESNPRGGNTGSIVLGISMVDTAANWNAANMASIREAARDTGMVLRVEDAHRSQEKQVAALRAFVSQHVDVIAFSPVVENG